MDIGWTRAGFERIGFEGWKRFGSLQREDLPPRHGVYVVVREPGERPTFLAESVGGTHKRKPLTVRIEELQQAWRDDADVLYVGKAGGAHGLKDRLWAYTRQGRGRSAGHAGGRFLWQLPESGKLLVGWREIPGVGEVEEALLALHIERFDRRPFANMKDGNRVTPNQARAYLLEAFND